MEVMEYEGYRKSLVVLRRKGGQYQKAADRAIVMQDHMRDPELRSNLPVTNFGETRIAKAVKYDIGGDRCRLVTVQDAGVVFLCFAGTHDDADKWLDKNKGLKVLVDKSSRPYATRVSVDIAEPGNRLRGDMGFTIAPLWSLLEERLQDQMLEGLHWRVAKGVVGAEVHINDDEIEALASQINDSDRQGAVFDMLIELRADNVAAATMRARAYLGELVPVGAAIQQAPEQKLKDSSDFQNIDIDSEHYRKLIEHYAAHADFKDWMLFMHPDQQQYVDASYNGPAKLSGVSGSGKTCVVVRRAIVLAERYPHERILVLTLNRSLATLIQGLVDKAAKPQDLKRIEVLPFFKLCQNLLAKFEPENSRLYDDVTWKTREHIDEVWREFYRCELNSLGACVLQRLHDSLISRGIDAEAYIREEFDWIRSATRPEARENYLKMERAGRTYPLDESFRRDLLAGLLAWERKMRFVGVTDYIGVANALSPYIGRIESGYRSVLIDESQDFGSIDMRLIRKLVAEADNDIFLCGDAAQQVSFKYQNLSDAGVMIPGARSHKLVLNYRNSRQILEVAHGVLIDGLSEQMLDSKDFEVLDPKFANFGGPTPLLLEAESPEMELSWAINYARLEAVSNPASKICVAVCGYSEHELAAFCATSALPILNGDARLEDGQVFVSDLENTKGFEFQCMIIVNCSAGVIPNPRSPVDEIFRDISRLYVAMTRARQQLVLSYCVEPSSFLSGRLEHFERATWESYCAGDVPVIPMQLPRRLEQLRREGSRRGYLEMSGEEYLYDEHAIGCAAILVDKLRNLITGRSRVVSGNPTEWKSIWQALRDTSGNVRSRQVFGPEGYRLFRERFASQLQPK